MDFRNQINFFTKSVDSVTRIIEVKFPKHFIYKTLWISVTNHHWGGISKTELFSKRVDFRDWRGTSEKNFSYNIKVMSSTGG